METTGAIFILLLSLAFFVVFILIMRLFGAWMLRIDEIIKLLKNQNAKAVQCIDDSNSDLTRGQVYMVEKEGRTMYKLKDAPELFEKHRFRDFSDR